MYIPCLQYVRMTVMYLVFTGKIRPGDVKDDRGDVFGRSLFEEKLQHQEPRPSGAEEAIYICG